MLKKQARGYGMISVQQINDLSAYGIAVIAGERSHGRCVDHSSLGRQSNGILYIYSGEATFAWDGGRAYYSDGDLVFLSKGAKYRMTYTAERTSFVVVNFELRDREGQALSFFEGIVKPQMHQRREEIKRLMDAFCACADLQGLGVLLRRKELLYRALGMILMSGNELDARGGTLGRIAEGVRLLEQTYLENLPISTFAEASRVSVTHFRNLFQRQFSMSPLKYRIRLRIERAYELLSEGDFTVSEAAYASGFENLGYFSRCYRSIVGQSPAETKRHWQGEPSQINAQKQSSKQALE